jgi:2-C-methyl-D-erythritol 4-phosphate cytidylyltransferase
MNIAIILAGGKGRRMKGIDKVLFKIKGKPLFCFTLEIFEKHLLIDKIIFVARKNYFKDIILAKNKYGFKKIAKIVEGGQERQDSAFFGLKAAEEIGARKGDLVLFHNAANPLVSPKEISDLILAGKKYQAGLLAQPAKDTIKEVNEDGFLKKTLDRKKIFLAQVPQIIEYDLAKTAFEKAAKDNFYGTDDVSLVERLGKKVKIIPCSYKNIKITTPEDLKIIEAFLSLS